MHKRNMKKGKKRLLTSLLAVALVMACCFGFSMNSYAYWDFGTVGLSLGKTSVSLTSGQSEAVSVSLSPASSDQLPGCGMEECPRICGDKNCYNNVYGQCICNGSTLSTYYPTATVSSDNTSVATATYNNGAVTIRGVGEGEAKITVVGSLRQYTDSPEQTITVTVSANTGGWSASVDSSGQSGGSSSGNSGSSGGSGNTGNSGSSGNAGNSGGSGSSGDTVAATQVAGTENADTNTTGNAEGEIEEIAGEEENAEGEAEEDEGITKVESDKGTIWFVPTTGLPQGQEQFEEILGDENQYVDFQLKDDAGNVVYAWEFWGSDVNEARDMDFTIESSSEPFEGCSYGSSNDSLYLYFPEEGEFVGKATISYRVSDYFPNGAVLNLYRYNPEDDTVELVAEGLTVDNGYVNMELDRGGYYILTTEDFLTEPEEEEEEEIVEEPEETEVTDELIEPEEAEAAAEEHTGLSAGAIAAIVIIAAAVAALIIFLAIRAVRKRKNGDGDGPEGGTEEIPGAWIREVFEEDTKEKAGKGSAESPETGSEEDTKE